MILFEKRAAIKAFYYLMAVDGAVTSEEMKCFNEIGSELDPTGFSEYCNEIITECEFQLQNIIDEEDYYEVALEGLDKALVLQSDDVENSVTVRLLVWDMLVIAFSNEDYSSCERRLIKHIVRTMAMDRSVFLEMEQIIKANAAVEKELKWVNQSNRPYDEIRPVVDELERRQKVIISCARQLIEDELYTPIERVALPGNGLYVGAVDMMMNFGTTVAQKTSGWGRKTAEVTRTVTSTIGKQTKGLFSGRKSSKDTETALVEGEETGDPVE